MQISRSGTVLCFGWSEKHKFLHQELYNVYTWLQEHKTGIFPAINGSIFKCISNETSDQPHTNAVTHGMFVTYLNA